MFSIYPHLARAAIFIFLVSVLISIWSSEQRFTALRTVLNHTTFQASTEEPLAIKAQDPALLLLQADALVLPMTNGTAQLTARVRDAVGNPVAGVIVQLQSNLGNVTPNSVTTDGNGVATATFTSTGSPGRALVTATTAGLSREAAIQLINPAVEAAGNVLSLEFPASQLALGQASTLNVVLRNSAGQPVAGELITLFGSLGEVTPASAISDANGRITATYRAGQNGGSAMITALAGVAAKSVSFQVGTPGSSGQAHKSFLPVVTR